jgi:hypothetical protein
MSGRFVAVVVALAITASCGVGSDADDPSNQPEVTVLGTTVATGEQPRPTIGSAVSTER